MDSLLYDTNINLEYVGSLCVTSCPLCLCGSKSRMIIFKKQRLRVSAEKKNCQYKYNYREGGKDFLVQVEEVEFVLKREGSLRDEYKAMRLKEKGVKSRIQPCVSASLR